MTTTATPHSTSNGKTTTADPWGEAPARPVGTNQGGNRRPQLPALSTYTLTTRKATGVCAYPLIMLDGDEYSGKSTMAVELAADPRIGQTWMLTLGEDIDWLGAVADFDIVNHNGEWWQIMAAAQQIRDETIRIKAAAKPGDPVPLVIIDSATKIHHLLSTWAEQRARTSQDNHRRLLVDPNADVNIGPAYWNPANRRHQQLMAVLRSMPAIVVLTARGKMVTAFDAKGQPVAGSKVYSVQANSDLGFATTAWVRLSKDSAPQIVGARMARGGIRPGYDKPLIIDGNADPRFEGVTFSLPWLIFEVLKFNGDTAQPSRAIEPVVDAAPDPEVAPPSVRVVPADADEAPGKPPADVVHPAES